MVFTDHQVRQFYVIDETRTAEPIVKNGKFYVKYKDPSGKYITTDKIDSGCIRDIRITKQPGFTPKTWNIYPSKTSVTDTYVLHMLFRSVFGGGVDDFFIKDPAILATPGDSVNTLVDKLYNAIKEDFKNVGDVTSNNQAVPFYITDNGTYLTITEVTPDYDSTNTIRGMYQLHLDLDIHCGEKAELRDTDRTSANYGNVIDSGNPWGIVNGYIGSTAVTAIKDYKAESVGANEYFYYSGTLYKNTGSTTTAGSLPTLSRVTNFVEYSKGKDGLSTANGPMVAEMEYFFSKGRADLFGYMGFPDINPSKMVANPKNDYYILDIKYFYQEAGVNNQNSEKELSFACSSVTVTEEVEGTDTEVTYTGQQMLEGIITNIIEANSGTATTEGRFCKTFTPKRY